MSTLSGPTSGSSTSVSSRRSGAPNSVMGMARMRRWPTRRRGPPHGAYAARVRELLLVATTSTFDVRDLVRALERQAPEGVTVRSAAGLLAPRPEGEGVVREAARDRGATVVV